eukprot:TRINITY_DN66415_c3_g2_i1.p1 TRINITY_DN66415_c3_g2~~TRINITY_DN66415_c3_g2_i1.p1  ORF type:complete len:1084 (-),score=611.75 TRINITY_DN66415_c3_g2_i1:1496-4747(-)
MGCGASTTASASGDDSGGSQQPTDQDNNHGNSSGSGGKQKKKKTKHKSLAAVVPMMSDQAQDSSSSSSREKKNNKAAIAARLAPISVAGLNDNDNNNNNDNNDTVNNNKDDKVAAKRSGDGELKPVKLRLEGPSPRRSLLTSSARRRASPIGGDSDDAKDPHRVDSGAGRRRRREQHRRRRGDDDEPPGEGGSTAGGGGETVAVLPSPRSPRSPGSPGPSRGVSPVPERVDLSTMALVRMMKRVQLANTTKDEFNRQIDSIIHSLKSKYIQPNTNTKRQTLIDRLKRKAGARVSKETRRWLLDELAGGELDGSQLKYAQSGTFSGALLHKRGSSRGAGSSSGGVPGRVGVGVGTPRAGMLRPTEDDGDLSPANGGSGGGGDEMNFSPRTHKKRRTHRRASSKSFSIIPFNKLNQLQQQENKTKETELSVSSAVDIAEQRHVRNRMSSLYSSQEHADVMLRLSSPDVYLADVGVRLVKKERVTESALKLTTKTAMWYRERAVAYAFVTHDKVAVQRDDGENVALRKDWLVISDVDGIMTCPKADFHALWEQIPGKRHVFRRRNRVLASKRFADLSNGAHAEVFVAQYDLNDGSETWHYTLQSDYFLEKYELVIDKSDEMGVQQHVTNMNMFSNIFMPKEVRESVVEKLQRVGDWQFDIFDLHSISDGHTLYFVGYHFFRELGLVQEFGIEEDKLRNFLHELEHSYKLNPYHNAIHGADVCQSSLYFVKNGIEQHKGWRLNSIQKLALCVSALAHDVAHPGVTNSYLVKSDDELAIVYNDKSVLENLHAATLFTILSKDECNIFCNLETQAYTNLRRMILELVLATDLAHHFDILNKFKSKVLVKDFDPVKHPKHKVMLMTMALKCSDIGHPLKPHAIHLEWSQRCFTEFYAQGDRERARGVKISPFCDRLERDEPRSQLGFVKFLVRPLIRTFVDTVFGRPAEGDKSVWIVNLNYNDGYWKMLVDKDEEEKKKLEAKRQELERAQEDAGAADLTRPDITRTKSAATEDEVKQQRDESSSSSAAAAAGSSLHAAMQQRKKPRSVNAKEVLPADGGDGDGSVKVLQQQAREQRKQEKLVKSTSMHD